MASALLQRLFLMPDATVRMTNYTAGQADRLPPGMQMLNLKILLKLKKCPFWARAMINKS